MRRVNQTCVILSNKKWNKDLVKNLSNIHKNFNWVLIDNRKKFNLENLKAINTAIIFIPHWSFIISKEIFSKYECVVFHMTDLPYGRGGSPLQNLISRGIYQTKISAIKVEKGIDTGPIYLKENLKLNGTATEIFERANLVIQNMITSILYNKLKPTPQIGRITEFKRRSPNQSNMSKLNNLNKVYDYIRMLDAEGYPHAYIETSFLKFEFTDALKKNKDEIIATVRIKIKSNEK